MTSKDIRRKGGADKPDVMQALAVYSGRTCIGHLLSRGKRSFAWPLSQIKKLLADALSQKAGGTR
jgi:hypothetical protein